MDEMLKGMLLQILNISSIFPSDFYQNVSASLNSYLGGDVLTAMNTVMRDTVFAIGASLLTLFMLMELVAMVNRSSSDGGITGVKLPSNILIKFGIYAFLYCNLGKVLLGIQETVVNLSSRITETEISIDTSALNVITNTFANMDIFSKIGAFILIIIVFCIVQVIFFVIQTTVYFRIFELFIIYTFAPIPLATLASQEFRQTAINYLKNFLAVCLQSAVILLSFKLYNIIIVASIPTTLPDGLSAWDVFMQILVPMTGYLFVLCASVFSSGRIAKSLINAI